MERGEIRLGNFFVRDEGDNEHIRATDLNSCFTFRVWRRMPLGIWLSNMIRMGDKALASIRTYLAVMWSVMSVVPDDEYVEDLLSASKACLSRHPDWYGVKSSPTEGDDASALSEVEGVTGLEEEVRGKMGEIVGGDEA